MFNFNKVICIGSLGKDVFFSVSEGKILKTPQDILSQEKIAFELGAKYKIKSYQESVGGCAANVSQGLSKLGIQSACCSVIGNDDTGQWLIKELKKNKVKLNNIKAIKKISSDISIIVVDDKTHDHVIFYNRQANEHLKIVSKDLKKYNWIFIGSLNGNWTNNLDKIIEVVKKDKRKKIAFNPGQGNIKENPQKIIRMLKFTEVLLVNKDEAIEIVMHMNNIQKEDLRKTSFLLKKISQKGVKQVIITEGKKGVNYYKTGDLCYYKVINTEKNNLVIDTTGAGDSFNSGFLAGTIKGKNFKNNLYWGMANSESVIQYYGAQKGLLNSSAIKRKSLKNKYQIKEIKLK